MSQYIIPNPQQANQYSNKECIYEKKHGQCRNPRCTFLHQNKPNQSVQADQNIYGNPSQRPNQQNIVFLNKPPPPSGQNNRSLSFGSRQQPQQQNQENQHDPKNQNPQQPQSFPLTKQCKNEKKYGNCRNPNCQYIHQNGVSLNQSEIKFGKFPQHQNRNNEQQINFNFQQRSHQTYAHPNSQKQEPLIYSPPISISQIIQFKLLQCRGFLPIIQCFGFNLIGIVTASCIQFYPIQQSGNLDIKSRIEFKPPCIEINNAWIYYNIYQTVLVVVCRLNQQTSLRSILIYPNFTNDQTHVISIKEVSITEILYCYLQPIKGELYTFSQDGSIRKFDYRENEFHFSQAYQLPDCIRNAELIEENHIQSIFIVGTQKGQIFLLKNQQLTLLNEISGLEDLIYDAPNRRLLALVVKKSHQHQQDRSEIYKIKDYIEGPVYEFSRRLVRLNAFQDYNGNSFIVAQNQFSQLDFLRESQKPQNSNFVDLTTTFNRSFSYPEFQKHTQIQLNMVAKLSIFETINANQVCQKYLMLYRMPDQTKANSVEIFRIIPEII